MTGQLNESLPFTYRVPVARYASVVVSALIGVFILQLGWSEAGASMTVLQDRLFLLDVGLVIAVLTATTALVPWWDKAKPYLVASHFVVMGLYVGLAVATTDWSHWSLRGWWQGWWAFPLLGAQIQQIVQLSRR